MSVSAEKENGYILYPGETSAADLDTFPTVIKMSGESDCAIRTFLTGGMITFIKIPHSSNNFLHISLHGVLVQ